jgi:hypothetical protein
MDNKVFRQSSIDRVQSPEQLNDYIKVSNPSVWVVIIASIILVGSILIWSIFGTVELNKTVTEVDENGQVVERVVSEKMHPIKFIIN